MGTRTSYAPGTFCWVDLSTSDREGAKRFYGELFGWEFEERPGAGGTYSLAVSDGEAVGALVDQASSEVDQGLPPHWNSYVSVDDAQATVQRVGELGGTVLGDAFPADDAGVIGVVIDPAGATLFAWQAKEHAGAGRVNEPGCLCWNELATDDVEAASGFYADLFGWRLEEIDTQGGPRYWTIRHQGAASGRNGGVRELGPAEAGARPNWVPYFAAESTDAVIERAQGLGGSTLVPATQVPSGRFAGLRDPQGAAFSIADGDFDE